MTTGKYVHLYAELVYAYSRGVLLGISQYAREHGGWDVSFSWDFGPGLSKHQAFINRPPQGILLLARHAETWEELRQLAIPTVNICNLLDSMVAAPLVCPDDVAVGKMAADYFLRRGFRSFAFAGMSQYRFSQQRWQGYANALATAGLACQVLSCRYHSGSPGYGQWDFAACHELFRQLPKPLALFACFDILAFQAAGEAQKLGYRVPDDIAILGVDNDEVFCGLANVPISSIRLPMAKIGCKAAEVLAKLMDGNPAPAQPVTVRPVEVITRRSSDTHVVSDPEVATVLRYIRDSDARKINVTDLVKLTTLSRRALEMRFHKAMGRSPHEEIHRVQMERAAVLLARFDHPTGISIPAEVIDRPDAATLLTDFASFQPKQFRRKRQKSLRKKRSP